MIEIDFLCSLLTCFISLVHRNVIIDADTANPICVVNDESTSLQPEVKQSRLIRKPNLKATHVQNSQKVYNVFVKH